MSKYYIDLVDSEGNVIDTDDEVFDNIAEIFEERLSEYYEINEVDAPLS